MLNKSTTKLKKMDSIEALSYDIEFNNKVKSITSGLEETLKNYKAFDIDFLCSLLQLMSEKNSPEYEKKLSNNHCQINTVEKATINTLFPIVKKRVKDTMGFDDEHFQIVTTQKICECINSFCTEHKDKIVDNRTIKEAAKTILAIYENQVNSARETLEDLQLLVTS